MTILKQSVENLDNVDEGHHDLYTASADGKSFALTGVIGMKTQADIDKLQTSLTASRNDTKAVQAKLSVFADVNSETIADDLQELATLRITEGKVDNEKFMEQVDGKVKILMGPHDREMKLLQESNTALSDTNTKLNNAATTRFVQDDANKAMDALKLTDPGSREDAMLHMMGQFTKDEHGQVLNAEGLTTVEWLTAKQSTRGRWWGNTDPDGGLGGKGKHQGANPFTRENWNMGEQAKLDPTVARNLAKAAGTTVDGGMPPYKK